MSTSPRLRNGSGLNGPMQEQGHDYVIKAILLGDTGVGKTSFLHTFLHGKAPPPGGAASVSKMAETNGQRIVSYHDKRVRLTLWDTAGQERYRSLTASYYRGAHACIIMYDVNNEESFNNVTTWLESVLEYGDTTPGTHTLLVGTSRTHHHHPLPSPSTLPNTAVHNSSTLPTSLPTTTAHNSSLPSSTTLTTTLPSSSTTAHNSSQPGATAVARQRAEQLASHYLIPHFEVDCQHDPKSVEFVVDTLVTLVMTRALDNQVVSTTIQPYSSRLELLVSKTHESRSRCSRCCSF